MEPVAPVPAPSSRKVAEPGTEYVVFKQAFGDASIYTRLAGATARTTEDAIKTVVESLPEDNQAGVYVAVSASRWNVVTVEPKVERTLIVKAANS